MKHFNSGNVAVAIWGNWNKHKNMQKQKTYTVTKSHDWGVQSHARVKFQHAVLNTPESIPRSNPQFNELFIITRLAKISWQFSHNLCRHTDKQEQLITSLHR